MTILHRATTIEEAKGRTLEGRAYRYDHPSRVTDDNWASSYFEEIARGADHRTLAHRASFPLAREHTEHGGHEVGTVSFHHSDDERSLMFRAVVDKGPQGDKVLAEIEEWSDVSVTFDPLVSRQRTSPLHGPIVTRTEIKMMELALAPTGMGLVKGAEVLAVRSTPVGTPRLDAAKRRRAALTLDIYLR